MSSKSKPDTKGATASKAPSRLPLFVITALIIVGLAVMVAVSVSRDKGGPTPDPVIPTEIISLPQDVSSSSDDLPYSFAAVTAPSAPVAVLWFDPQCPACATFDEISGGVLADAVEKGQISLVLRPATFIDDKETHDKRSEFLVSALGCAADQGAGWEFYKAMMPDSKADAVDMATRAGVPDLAAFEQCSADLTYTAWGLASNQTMFASGIAGTPSLSVDGVLVPGEVMFSPDVLAAYLADPAGFVLPSASS